MNMEARNGSDSAGGGRPKLKPLSSSADFEFRPWLVFFYGHAGKFPGVKEVLMKEDVLNETNAAKTKRLKDDYQCNATALSMLYEVCQDDKVASQVAVNHAATDKDLSARNLLKMIETRFTQKTVLKVQKLHGELFAIKVKAGETTALFCDRYTNLTTSITAADPTQLPTEIARQGILLNAIVLAFPILWAMLSDKDINTEASMLESILNHRMPNEIGKHGQGMTEAVAAYMDGKAKPKKFKKKPTRSDDVSGEAHEQLWAKIICWNCEKKGHRAVDCRKPKRARDDNDDGVDESSKKKKKKQFKKKQFPLKSAFKKGKGGKYGPKKSSPSMNEDGDFSDESANMMEEEFLSEPDQIVEESGIKCTTEIALHSFSRDPSLVCVDSGANIAIFKKKVGRGRSRQVTNRSISTAASGSRLRVHALFECGLINEVRLCPDAAANLLPTNDINDCGCSVLLEKVDEIYTCKITADPHGEPFIIDCVRDNGLWWITELQFLDIVERNGLSVEKVER